MVTKTNLAIRNKYIDLDLESCVLPLYLSKRFNHALQTNTLPNMVFKGALWEPKSIVANALAKKLDAQLMALIFNAEPRSRTMKHGERTLITLKLLLKKYSDAGEKKLFIVEDLKHFPAKRYDELFELIQANPFHHFIFFSSEKSLSPFIKYYPQISFDFKIDHSPIEEEAYWHQCQQLLSSFNRSVNLNELKLIIKSTYFFWISLIGRETLQSLRKELEFIPINPVKETIELNPARKALRLYPPVNR
jgi:hypothetical protein